MPAKKNAFFFYGSADPCPLPLAGQADASHAWPFTLSERLRRRAGKAVTMRLPTMTIAEMFERDVWTLMQLEHAPPAS